MSNLRRDIRIWTDGEQAHASIEAQTERGPVSFRASAPLAVVRDRVVQALTARGLTFDDVDPDVETVVGFLGRWSALKRLRKRIHHIARKASPAHALVRQLASNPALQRLVQQALPAGALAAQFVPGMGPAALAARMALQRLQSRGVPVQIPGLAGSDTTCGDDVYGLGLGELIEGATGPARAATVAPKVAAATALLRAAPTNPNAQAKVKKIVALAKAGDPRGASAYRALKVAKAADQAKSRPPAARAPLAAVQAVRSASARTMPPAPPPPQPGTIVAPGPAPRRRGFDFFHYWRRGVE